MGAAPALAYDPMHSGVEILIFDDDQITAEMQDGDPLVIGDLNSYSDGIRCEIPTLACTGSVEIGYRMDDTVTKIGLTFGYLDPDGTEEAVITTGRSVVTTYKTGQDSEQSSGTFRATFTTNSDGTLGFALELTHVGQSPVTITIHFSGEITVY